MTARAHGPTPQPPLTPAGVAVYAGILAPFELIVSGRIPDGPTTAAITYFVLDKSNNAIVGNITLPNAAKQNNAFRITVQVASLSESYDVGVFEAGGFVSAGFTVEAPDRPRGAVGHIR